MQKTVLAVSVAVCVLMGVGLVFSTSARAESDPVVARVGGEVITLGDVRAAKETFPDQVRAAPLEQVFDVILSILIDSKLAADDAEKRGLDKDVDIARQLSRVREQVLERAALSRHIDQAMTESLIRERHQEASAALKGQKELQVSHILLKTREDAEAVIAELKGGADFAELARTRSVGPSASDGGVIGYIGPGDTVAPFEAAAFALKSGTFSDAPVQTQFGWHVILAGEKRARTAPALEDVRDRIVASLSRELGLAYIQSLRKTAKIERFGMDGKPNN